LTPGKFYEIEKFIQFLVVVLVQKFFITLNKI